MKKLSMKTVILMLLVCAMGISLCACGSANKANTDGGSAPAAESSAATAAPSAATPAQTAASGTSTETPAYVYKSSFVKINDDPTVSYINAAAWTENGVYCTGEKITGSIAPEDAEPQYYGQFDITEPALYFVGFDGTVKQLENYRPTETPKVPAEKVAAGASAEILEGYDESHPCEDVYNYTANVYNNSLGVLPDGNLLVNEVQYFSWEDVPDLDWNSDNAYDHYHYMQNNMLRTLDSTGKEVSTVKLEVPENEWLYTAGNTDKAGNVLFQSNTDTGETAIVGINPATGEKVYEVKTEQYLNNILTLPDGTVYVLVWGDGTQLMKFDPETKTFSDPVDLSGDVYNLVPSAGEYPFYYTSGVYCYGLNPASEAGSVKLFNWMDCDIDPDSAYNYHVDSNSVIRTLINSYDNYTSKYDRSIAEIRKTPYDPSTQKKELTLATQYLSYELRNTVVNFNRKNDACRIVVRDYSEYNTEDDYSAGLTKLTTEIMAGNCPDLIDMNGLNLSQIASKGLLEDLYPWLDADPELSRDDFLPNALSAAESNGKLMHTVSYFTIDTVIGASAIVGDTPGWTYEALNSALRDMPDGCTPFDVSTIRDTVLNSCLNLDMADFVNWATGEVNFDNQEFIDLLKFAAQFPETYDWEQYDYTTDSTEARIKEGRQMLYATSIGDIDSLNYIEASYNGIPVTFIGYPTNNGTGNTISTDSGYAMATSCSDKETAWSFLRTFFTPSYYENNCYYGLPVQKELLAKYLKKACTPTYELDDDGNYRLDANGERIPEERYYAIGDGIYTYYALSQEMADRFMNLVETTTKVSVIDESIKDIVSKQAAPFFAGQKSAEEVAKLVQSNAKIYVNEQR